MSKKLPPEARRALGHVGGPTTTHGDAEIAEKLARIFDVRPAPEDEESVRAHVHGFHSYPARLHPNVARQALATFAPEGGTVLDPFCGSGTVLVEARLRGLRAIGTDVNPLAIRLARLKVRGVPAQERRALVEHAKKIEGYARKRYTEKARPTMRYPEEDVALFAPHVLLELDSIRDGIDRVHSKGLREDLELVLSAILTKASRQRGDTGTTLGPRRLAPGFVSKMFVAKAEELAAALEEFERALPPGAPEADVHADDARTLGTLKAGSVDLVLTSPPYAATYDYLEHHDVRLRWLRLKPERFAELEVGARRAYAKLTAGRARDRWDDELGRTLKAMARSMRPSALLLLVIADSAVRSMALRAETVVENLAPRADLEVVAIASQARPHFHTATRHAFADRPRREHLIALRRTAIAAPDVGSARS
ncbi:MAG: DNA adenine methylase [Deltaproteobacteria bacterium]|nr:DNA adenine methylase [Deltaproteobacteria bacterium]